MAEVTDDWAHQLPMSTRETFAGIYRDNGWGDAESRSGPGSTVFRTRVLRPALAGLLQELGIRSVLDAGCGDFNWMRLVDLADITYTGADIVPGVVDRNCAFYAGPSRRFICLDMARDPWPTADLVICRDCLVHLSFSDVFQVLCALQASGARYLLATTFEAHPANQDIITGDWRPLNMERPPFAFPPPLRKLWDGPRPDGTYPDKILALWEARALRKPAVSNPDCDS